MHVVLVFDISTPTTSSDNDQYLGLMISNIETISPRALKLVLVMRVAARVWEGLIPPLALHSLQNHIAHVLDWIMGIPIRLPLLKIRLCGDTVPLKALCHAIRADCLLI